MRNRALHRVDFTLNPEVHRVACHDPRPFDLLKHLKLKLGINISQKHILRRSVRFGNDGIERFEHVQFRIECPRFVEVISILAFPAERFPRDSVESFDIDPVLPENRHLIFAKIIADHSDDTHRSKVAGRNRKVGRRTTEYFVCFTKRGLYRIESYGTDNKNRCTQFQFLLFTKRAANPKIKVVSNPPSGPYPPPRIKSRPATPVVHNEARSRPDKDIPRTKPIPAFQPRCMAYGSHSDRA